MSDAVIVTSPARHPGRGDAYRFAADLAARHVRRRLEGLDASGREASPGLSGLLVDEAVGVVSTACGKPGGSDWSDHAAETTLAVARRAALDVFAVMASSPDWGDVSAVRRWRASSESEFLGRHGVKPYRNSHRNVLRILKSSGHEGVHVRGLADRIGTYGAQDGPFDHGMVLGRDRVPLMLVGHPYGLMEEDCSTLLALQELGLIVRTGGESFYGYGTRQVIVSSPWVETM